VIYIPLIENSGNFRRKVLQFTILNQAKRFIILRRWLFDYFVFPIVLLPVSLLALFLARALEPLVRIRIGRLEASRIGHLAANTELYLRRQVKRRDRKREFVFFSSGPPANHQLLIMVRRRVPVIQNRLACRLFDSLRRRISTSSVWVDLPFHTNEYYEFSTMPPQLRFTAEEEARGRQLLANMGIEPGAPFVCFHARDKIYLDMVHNYRSRKGWSYQDFRDCDINNYLLAAEYLSSRGIYALRMGAVVEQKICTTSERVIDYATRFRSDFGDVYLPAKCKFFLGSTSGIRLISAIFNVPIAFANSVPLGDIALGEKDVFIPKKLWSVKERRFLSFREIIEIGADWWLKGELYTQAGLEGIENTAEEILALVKEMNERLDDKWVSNEKDEGLQRRFRALFYPGHRCYGFPSRIGAEFLRQNRILLDW